MITGFWNEIEGKKEEKEKVAIESVECRKKIEEIRKWCLIEDFRVIFYVVSGQLFLLKRWLQWVAGRLLIGNLWNWDFFAANYSILMGKD